MMMLSLMKPRTRTTALLVFLFVSRVLGQEESPEYGVDTVSTRSKE
jgi:hypothetical protein